MARFVPLHVHTEFSLMNSLIKVSDLVQVLENHGYPACAVTDHDTLAGLISFSLALQERKIIPITGMEVTVFSQGKKFHLTLLVRTKEGYRNLLQISQVVNREGGIKKEKLFEKKEGIVVLSGCRKSELVFYSQKEERDRVLNLLKEFKENFKEDFYVEVQKKGKEEEFLLEMADFLKIKGIATVNCHFLKKEDEVAYGILSFIKKKSRAFSLESFVNFLKKKSEGVLKHFASPQEVFSHFSGWEFLCYETLNLLDRVEFVFPSEEKIGLPRVVRNPEKVLRSLVFSGLKKRIGRMDYDESRKYYERAEKELEVISKKGLCDYFLVIHDVVNHAKKSGIPVGKGRGSAVSSLVAYALGITEVDPLKHDLVFERFLSLQRKDLPDVDLDFSIEGRTAVMNYVVEKYGKERTGRIMTVNRFSFDTALEEVEKAAGSFLSEREKKEVAEKLSGLPKSFSQHPSGMIISGKKLSDVLPVMSTSDGKLLVQVQTEDLSRMGVIKFDFLGLKVLSVIEETIKALREREGISFNPEVVDLEDEYVYELLSKGDTVGVFQMEGEGFTEFLKVLSPRCFNDLVVALALYRPATLRSSLCDEFLKRRREWDGLKKSELESERFEKLLEKTFRSTHGIPVFQEDVILLLKKVAGYSAEEAEYFRRAISHGKDKREIQFLKEDLQKRMKKNGWKEEEVRKVSEIVEKFAEYGFNKAHAVAYAHLSFLTACLKTYFPSHYFCSYLNYAVGDAEKTEKVVRYLSSRGIEVLPPDVNESEVLFSVKERNKIQVGLACVKGVGKELAEKIIEERKKGKFESFYDFCRRMQKELKTGRQAVENLIKAGAFDRISQEGRRKLLYEVLFVTSSQSYKGVKEKVMDFSDKEKALYEKEVLGFSLSL